jgi:hypothetical protein
VICSRARPAFLVVGLLLALGACDRRTPLPLRPTGPASAAGTRFDIEGPAEIAPGQSATFRATSTSAAGIREDVTNQAAWEVGAPDVLSVTGPGRITALRRGESDIMVQSAQLHAVAHVLVLEPGTYRLTGQVREDGFALASARVAVTSGTGTGLTALTNAAGAFVLYGVAGAIDLTVSRDGYQTTVRSVTVTSHTATDVGMRPVLDPLRLDGQWTLVIRASTACSGMPPQAERREYPVSIAQTGSALQITLHGKFYFTSAVTVTGRVLNDSLTFGLPSDPVDGPWIMEQLSSGGWLGIAGTAAGRSTPSGVAGQLSGLFEHYGTGPRTWCTSDNHTFELVR